MQTFSHLQRNSLNKRALVKIFTALGLIFYEALQSVYPFLPSLFGLFFCYLLFFLNSKLRFYEVVYAFIYLTVYEVDKGFYFLSFVIFFTIYYSFIAEEIRKIIYCKWCLAFIYVTTAYLGYYLINAIIAFVLNEPMPTLGYSYIVNVLLDTVLVKITFAKYL